MTPGVAFVQKRGCREQLPSLKHAFPGRRVSVPGSSVFSVTLASTSRTAQGGHGRLAPTCACSGLPLHAGRWKPSAVSPSPLPPKPPGEARSATCDRGAVSTAPASPSSRGRVALTRQRRGSPPVESHNYEKEAPGRGCRQR